MDDTARARPTNAPELPEEDAARVLGELIRSAMRERDLVKADGTPAPAKLRQAMLTWLAERAPGERVTIDVGALGYLVAGRRGRWGRPMARNVAEFLELDEDEISALVEAATGGQPSVTATDATSTMDSDAYSRRLPWITTIAPRWMLSDVEDLLPTVVIVSTPDFADSSAQRTVTATLRNHARAEFVLVADAATLTDEPLEEAARRRIDNADLAVLVITEAHVRETEGRSSRLEDVLPECAMAKVPMLVLVTPSAWRASDEQKWRTPSMTRTLVDLVCDPPVLELNLPPFFRVVKAPTEGHLQTAVQGLLNGMSRWGLTLGAKLGDEIWPDTRLQERELSSGEVWVYTPTFYFETVDPLWMQVVEENLHSCHKQRWLYPADRRDLARRTYNRCAETYARAVRLWERAGDPTPALDDLVAFFEVPKRLWWPEIVIYDPHNDPPMSGSAEDELVRAAERPRLPRRQRDRGSARSRDAFMYALDGTDTPSIPLVVQFNYRLGDGLAKALAEEFEGLCTADVRSSFGVPGSARAADRPGA